MRKNHYGSLKDRSRKAGGKKEAGRSGTGSRIASTVLLCSLLVGALTGCGASGKKAEKKQNAAPVSQMTQLNHKTKEQSIEDKYGTCYEIFVRSFYDSDGDGIGDLNGVTKKLDYINDGDLKTNTDLGCDSIWLMPIMPSTTYHKYDVTDYENIDKEYGTLDDFNKLVKECHKRGIRVIIDFVMNHTSSKHPWFLEASKYLRSIGDGEPDPSVCPYVDYYHFTKENLAGYTQLSGTNWYYESRFWSGMPDLNLENEAVRKEFDEITSFWLGLGVDGFRMDAASQYETGNNETNTEILAWFNQMVKAKDPDAYIVCEVWTDSDVYSKYYASGVDSCFTFSFAGSDGLITKTARGQRSGAKFAESMQAALEKIRAVNPNAVDAPFFVNHDMNRAAGYFSGDDKEDMDKLAWGLNFLMTGKAYLYYGEEIGMKGSGDDPNKRLPMQWVSVETAEGMCSVPTGGEMQEMIYGSLAKQKKDAYSIYNYVKEAVQLRNRFPLIARGETTADTANSSDAVAAVMKTAPTQIPEGMTKKAGKMSTVYLFANTSGKEQTVKLSGEASRGKLAGVLVTGKAEVKLSDGTLTLPPYAIAVLQ